MIRDILQMVATFLGPLLSRYQLPLNWICTDSAFVECGLFKLELGLYKLFTKDFWVFD